MKIVRTVVAEVPDLGERIKQARAGRKVTELAYKSQISPAYWYKIESNEPESVTEEVIRRLEQVLGVDLGINFEET